MEVLYGLHPVEEAIRSGSRQLDHVTVARERDDAATNASSASSDLCRTAGIRVALESRDQLTRLARTDAHQGVLAVVRERKFLAIEDLLAPAEPTAATASSSPSTASKTPTTSEHCSAPPTAPASTASSSPNAAPPRSPQPSPRPPPGPPSTSASPASPTSSAPSSR